MTNDDIQKEWDSFIEYTEGSDKLYVTTTSALIFARVIADMASAAEREAGNRRRGTLMFNPYTGTPRHPADIASDPHGILLLDPEQTLLTSAIRARGQA